MTTRMTLLGLAAAAALALPAGAQRIPVGHLMDISGATSDVGMPSGAGRQRRPRLGQQDRNGVAGRPVNVLRSTTATRRRARSASTSLEPRQASSPSRDGARRIPRRWCASSTHGPDPLHLRLLLRGADRCRRQVGRQGVEATPYNFFYGPSYSDALRAMLQWAADDWKAKGGRASRNTSTWAPTTPIRNSPKAAGETLAQELGFEVLPAVSFALTPGDYTAQCLTLKRPGRQLRLSRQHRGLQHLRPAGLPDGRRGRAVPRQCLGHGRERHEGRRRRGNGVVFPVRTGAVWGAGARDGDVQAISRISDPAGTAYRPVHYVAGVCAAMLMVEAMEMPRPMAARSPASASAWLLCSAGLGASRLRGRLQPSTFTGEDHRGTIERGALPCRVGGDTSQGSVSDLMAPGPSSWSR